MKNCNIENIKANVEEQIKHLRVDPHVKNNLTMKLWGLCSLAAKKPSLESTNKLVEFIMLIGKLD